MPPKRPPPGTNQLRTPSQRSVRPRVSPASRSLTATPSLRHILPDSPAWADPRTTCLSLGLDPSDATHKDVICNKCFYFWESKLRSDISNLAHEQRSVRRTICERPFDCSDAEQNSKYKYKALTRDKLKSLFASPGLVVFPAIQHVTPSSRGVCSSTEQPSGLVDKSTTRRIKVIQ